MHTQLGIAPRRQLDIQITREYTTGLDAMSKSYDADVCEQASSNCGPSLFNKPTTLFAHNERVIATCLLGYLNSRFSTTRKRP